MTRTLYSGDSEPFNREESNYKSGSESFSKSLVDHIVERFLATEPIYDVMLNFSIGKELSSHLKKNKELDGQAFLDAVIQILEQRDNTSHDRYIDYLSGDLINLFQNTGQKLFTLDYRFCFKSLPLPLPGVVLGLGLKGSAEKKIYLHYRLPEDSPHLAYYTVGHGEHCQINVTGKPYSVGSNAHNSSYSLEYAPDWLGAGAEQCSFLLENGEDDASFAEGRYKTPSDFLQLTLTDNGKQKEVILPKDFFANGNHIFIPGRNNWREVLE